MAGPNINISSNPDYVAGGGFGAVIQSTNTSGIPAAIVDGNLTVLGSISSTTDLSGGITFANGALIAGDYSTLANRQYFQSNTGIQTILEISPPTGSVVAGINMESSPTYPPSTGPLAQILMAGASSFKIGSLARSGSAVPIWLGVQSATALTTPGLVVNADNTISVMTSIKVPTHTPATSSDTGVVGTITWDASYVYVCIATNTWKRVAIATW